MRIAGTLRIGAAAAAVLALGSCTCAPPPVEEHPPSVAAAAAVSPGEPVAAPALPPAAPGDLVEGHVVLARAGKRVPLAGVEVHLVPEERMAPFLAGRLELALAERGRRDAALADVRAEVKRLVAEKDRANARWMKARDLDLARKLELQVRPTGMAERRALQARNVQETRTAWDEALRAAQRAEEEERRYDALRADTPWARGPFFLDGLPEAAQVAHSDAGGRFVLAAPPGRYAVVAWIAEAPDGSPDPPHWLVWTTLGAGAAAPLVLDEGDLHGADCAACLVVTRELR